MLVHGLMGRGTTWSRQLPWLARRGAVYTGDAPWHRGVDIEDAESISTELPLLAELGRRSRSWAARPCWSDIRWALCTRGAWRPSARSGRCGRGRGHGAGLRRPDDRSLGAVGARPARRIRISGSCLRRIRTRGGPVLSGGLRPDGNRVAITRKATEVVSDSC